ncbi:hypothetical protein SAMN05216571_101250 [Onishia taeanensis]|uniref:Uncharacterized protein n=1 Tax=Onishia taeanensis TaxID=284577 RepID=A0A1G7N835_9GAMM|nr:hypothetical protein [Halomonas taeanensis]SDF69490.1 hypothetical protein SAMN05216571_101250 [Halomonas taeanensis]
MNKAKVAAAFNRWMDEYIADPQAFEQEVATVLRHQKERSGDGAPTYGDDCAALLEHYMDAE